MHRPLTRIPNPHRAQPEERVSLGEVAEMRGPTQAEWPSISVTHFGLTTERKTEECMPDYHMSKSKADGCGAFGLLAEDRRRKEDEG